MSGDHNMYQKEVTYDLFSMPIERILRGYRDGSYDLDEVMEVIKDYAPHIPSEKRMHITDGEKCWCDPIMTYKDAITGAEVWVHKEEPV